MMLVRIVRLGRGLGGEPSSRREEVRSLFENPIGKQECSLKYCRLITVGAG
jgi:hypothetical protein